MNRSIVTSLFLVFLFPAVVIAHSGPGGSSGFVSGLSHPVFGLDHMLAMLAVGVWAAFIGGRSTWLLPVLFVVFMVGGGISGFIGYSVPFVEQGIAVSVLVLGLLIACFLKVPLIYSSAIVVVFAFFHGHAHGVEYPMGAGILSYMSGFVLATLLLHLCGIIFSLSLKTTHSEKVFRLAGSSIMLAGFYFVTIS